MSARGLAALVVGLGGGYLKGKDRQRREDIEDEDRAYTMTQRARQQAENERADKLRTDMGNTSMPTTVDAAPVAMPIGSRDEPRAPEDVGIRAAGQTFTDRAAADKAEADYNTPQATAARQAQVAAAAGDPHLAQQLRTGSMQEQVAKLQLSAGERAELKAKFAEQINPLADFGQLGEFMSASAADGQGGKLKMQFVPAADGKTVALNMVNPDGSLKPTARTFDNDGKGLALAKAQLNGMPPEKMLEHFHREAVEARAAAAQAATQQHQAATLAEQSRHNKATEGHQSSMLAAARAKATAGTGQPAAPQVTLKDLKDFDDDVNKRVTEIFQPKEGMNPDERTALGAKRNAVVSQANGVFHANATRGMPITAGTALQAIELAGDIKNITRRNGSDGQVYDTVLVNGMPIIVSAPLAKAAPTPAVPAPQPTPRAPLPTTASAPERQPAPAGSPQAAWEAKQARARTDMASAAAAKASSDAALSTQFQADKAALSPIDLARKYDKTRGKLSAKDAAELQAVERSIR